MDVPETYRLILILLCGCYGCIVCVFTFGLVRIRKQKPLLPPVSSRFVTLIIPVRNEAHNILRILEEILVQDYPAEWMEVIVSDDYSDDTSMEVAGRFAGLHPGFPLVLVTSGGADTNGPGKKKAIERAVAKAKGEILLFTDADTGRGPGWITSMVAGFGTPGTRMVLGPVYFCREKNLLQKIQSLEFLGLMGTTAGSAALGIPLMCNGANLAYTRAAFLQTGGFSKNLGYASGDDQFMMSSVRKHYGRGSLVFNSDPASSVSTEPESTIKGFLNQRIRWVSKSRGYRDPAVIFVGIVTYLTHLLLLAGMLAGFFIPELLVVTVLLWLAKIVIEYPMVSIMIRFFGKEKLTGYYFIAQVFQLVYVPVAGMLGLFIPYRWKGRRG